MDFVQFFAVIVGMIFIVLQVRDIANVKYNRQNDLLIEYNNKFESGINKKISLAISDGKSILKNDNFTEAELDYFLGNFYDLENALEKKLLDQSDVYNNFYYITVETYENKEIKDFLDKSRKESNDQEIFDKFDKLYQFMTTY